jgi:hypothetical protein
LSIWFQVTWGDRSIRIRKKIEYRFQLAADTPISKTKLINQVGYLADANIIKQLIKGTCKIPEEVDDATALILEEIGRISIQVTNGKQTITISKEEFQYFWKRVREGTASSYSGIHDGSCKATAQSDTISYFFANKITLISRSGVPSERWSYGITITLEKIAGLALVNKLCAILLMEVYFNMHNTIHFGTHMLNEARAYSIISPK